jgi:hypothetical protein
MVNPNAIPSTDLTGRREFIRRAVAGGLLATMAGPVGIGAPGPGAGLAAATQDDRAYWFAMMRRICEPVIENLAAQTLWRPLPAEVKTRVIAALRSTRQIQAGPSNWLLFPAMIEAFLAVAGAEWQPEPIDRALAAHESWYKGDGAYGDGPDFHWDYYNSYVIQPFLLTILTAMQAVTGRWQSHLARVAARGACFAAIQERLIAPDGSFPALGRSITYRAGAFHHLAHQAWRDALPTDIAPAQARCALTAVIRRTLEPAGTFDEEGWLRIGLAGHQPKLAESYISTGSLYLCSLVFHPLGLPASHRFWRDPAIDCTQRRIWSGADSPADHALQET